MHTKLDLNILFDNMLEGLVLRDRELKIIMFNSAAHNILGLTREQFEKRVPFDPKWKTIREDGSEFPQTDHPAIHAMKSGTTFKNVVMGVHKPNGEISWVSVNATPIFKKGDPLPVQVISTFTDITAQKKLVNDLKKSEEKFRAIFEHAPVGMVELDEHRNYVEVNNAFLQMIGYTAEELKTKTMFDLTFPDDKVDSLNMSARLDDRNFLLKKLKKRYITKSGKIVWGEVSSRSFEVEKNEPRHLFSVIADITEQKQMEENIAIQEAKLMHSSKMSALGEMAAGMAHEINNPLSIIGAYAGVLKSQINKDLPKINLDNINEKLGQIEKTVERVAQIVRGLKLFSRQADQDEKVSVPIVQVVEDTLVFCRERLKSSKVELNIDIPPDLTFKVRPNQITQVILNLLNNSYDSVHGTTKPWIEITACVEKNIVKLKVTDSGAKIPAKIQEKMMQPFFTTKGVGQGTGLGLSVSQGIIESHGGKFFYETNSPHNCFTMELPYDQ